MTSWIRVIDKRLARFLGVLAVAVAALVLGYAGLSQYLSRHVGGDFGRGWSDILFYDIQLLFFTAGPTQGAGPFPVALGIARFLAPASTALATLETLSLLLGDQLRLLSAALASGHAVVTGDGPVALAIARRLRERHRKVVLVSEREGAAAQGRQHRLLGVSGDPADAETLRRVGLGRASVLYACSDLGTTNAATALRARELSRAGGKPLACYAQVADGALCAALRARRIGAGGDARFRLDFFSLADTAAHVLLDRYPVVLAGGRPVRTEIIGFGPLGQAVLLEIARRRQPGGPRVPVALRGVAASEGAAFAEAFPVVARNSLLGCEGAERSAAGPPGLVFVCLPGNEETLSAGLAEAAALAGERSHVVICLSTPSPFGPVLSGRAGLLDNKEERLSVFGVVEEACVPDVIREDLVNQLARAIHRAYVANCAARGDTPEVNKSMRPWEELPDDLKDANIHQAEEIGVSLRAVDSEVVPESAGAAPDFSFSDSEVELLARMEHERWLKERRAKGYAYGPVREGRQHPDLVDWESLSATAKEKDRDYIRGLPAILSDAGFRIIRLNSR